MLTSRRNFLLSSALGLGTIVLAPAVRAWGDPLPGPTPVARVSGADGVLDATLAALPPFVQGTALRSVTVIPGRYLRRSRILVPPGVQLIATGCTFILQSTGKEDSLLEIRDTRDIMIEGGIWDGNKAIVKAKTEFRHTIRVVNSDRISLKNLVAQNAKGDGIYIGSQLNPCRDVVLEGVRCTKNHRDGLSVTACDGLRVIRSRFHANGGTAPMSGAVIEPNAEAAVVDNILFDECSFDNNLDRGFLVKMRVGAPTPVTGIELRNCDFVRNGRTGKNGTLSGGLVLLRPRLVKVTKGSWISGNQVGVFVQGTRPGDKAPAPDGLVVIDATTIDSNLKDGIFISNRIGHLEVNASKINSNSRKKKSRYNGIRIQQGYDVKITDSQLRKHGGYGVRADKKVRGVVITRSVLTGNKKGAIYKKGASVTVR